MEKQKYSYLEILYCIFILVFYSTGIVGISNPNTRELFVSLTPYTLISIFLITLLVSKTREKDFYIYITIVGVLTWLIEVIGVHTGLIFGGYEYSNVLGTGLFGVPFLIGVNWITVMLGAISIANSLGIIEKFKFVLIPTTAVVFDIILEPVAIKLNFWQWANTNPPLLNYIGWYLTATIAFLIYKKIPFKLNGIFWMILFIAQFIFFTILNLSL